MDRHCPGVWGRDLEAFARFLVALQQARRLKQLGAAAGVWEDGRRMRWLHDEAAGNHNAV